NCVFNANNSVSGGGAMFIHNASTGHVVNSSFFKNTASTSGGAVVLSVNNSNIVSENNIFYKNTANGVPTGAGSDITNFTGGANTWANNILQQGSSVPADNGTSIRNNLRGVDPLFVNEASPVGADLSWGTADDGLQLSNCFAPPIANGIGQIAAVGCSPAINAGDNTPVLAGSINTDLRDNPRIVCAIVDLGAYENQDCSMPAIASNQLQALPEMMEKEDSWSGVVVNPFDNDLQIRYSGAEKCAVTVLSANGKKMWTKSNISEGITHADASSWARGMYQVVMVTASGKKMNFKVVRL
ncbi:MAG: T9SS type A sorting domain-containing protein, partial [Chitinophagaceae bacterium]